MLIPDKKPPIEKKMFSTGWLPPYPDLRDYNQEKPEIATMAKALGVEKQKPGKADLRQWCSPIEDQMTLGACTAHAAVGIVEYFERRAFSNHIDGSRLFVYKNTRNLMGVKGDTGAWLRDTMKSLALCGIAPEQYWPYTDQDPDFDNDPPPFVYAVADNYEAIKFFCHDPVGMKIPDDQVLASVKKYLAAGVPSMFGFWGFPSSNQSNVKGAFPYPCPGEKAVWGHAIVAVGYDDDLKITNLKCKKDTKGALLIRNSWGTGWGDNGYGWLPYDYVLNNLALDFWSLINMEWIETRQFGV